MTELENKQKTWDNMSPEARNMVLNIDPTFTPDKLPTPVIDDDELTLLVQYISEYHDKVSKQCRERNSDGEWHCVGMIDGECYALDNIMKYIKDRQIIVKGVYQ